MINLRRTLFLFFKIYKRFIFHIDKFYYSNKTKIIFFLNNIKHGSLTSFGTPVVYLSKDGQCSIGNNLIMNNGHKFNPIGRNTPCYIVVNDKGILQIGNNVGMSSSAISCNKSIKIGDNVLLGGGVCIYDSDFHSINPTNRNDVLLDKEFTKTSSVIIMDNVFIGAHTTILKGVTIGENSVIGAGSVVTKNVAANEIWAGNPAKFIKKII
jgi:acetyltransferase-like isoleucine patch superfamily enzyme